MKARCRSRFVPALLMALWLSACGGGGDAAPLDLGGGLSMTADGVIVDRARALPEVAP